MRKSGFLLTFVLLSTIALAACSGAPATQPAASTAAPATQPAADSAATTQPEGCLGSADQAIVDLKCQKITVAVENAYLPFNYVLASTGKAGGWDYEAWDEICTRLHCTPVYTEVAWDAMIQSVANKQYDVAADGITVTDDRAKIVDFSEGYIQIQQRLLVKKGETRFTDLKSFVDNKDLVMGTQANTTNYETAKESLPESRIKAFEQMPFAVQALISGDVDAVMIDQVAGMGYMGNSADQIEFVGDSITSQDLGFVFPKGSTLLAPVNKAIEAMKADGALEKLNTKYFGPDFKISDSDIK
jgi:polar amino acid transport system substrate-binding protein